MLPALQRRDRFEGDVFVFHDDGMEALFEGRVDRDFQARRNL